MKINEVIKYLTENKEGKFINTSDCTRLRSVEYCKEYNTLVFHGDEYVLLGVGLDDEFIIEDNIKPIRGLRALQNPIDEACNMSKKQLDESLFTYIVVPKYYLSIDVGREDNDYGLLFEEHKKKN